MEAWPPTSESSGARRPRTASEGPRPQQPPQPPEALTLAQLTAGTLLQAQLPGSLTLSDRTQSQPKMDGMRGSTLSSTDRMSPLEVTVQNTRRPSTLPPLTHRSSRQPSPHSTDAPSIPQGSNSLRSASPLGPLQRLAREADVFAHPSLRPPAIRPTLTAAPATASVRSVGPRASTRSTFASGLVSAADTSLPTVAGAVIATPTASPATATAPLTCARDAQTAHAPTAYSGMLRSLDTSCGKLFPDFASDRQLYILLVPIETCEVYFYPTAYLGEILINHDAPCKPITLHSAVTSQKVIIDVKLHDQSAAAAASNKGSDGDGRAGGNERRTGGHGQGEKLATDDRSRSRSKSGSRSGNRSGNRSTTADHHQDAVVSGAENTNKLDVSRGDLAGHGITTYVIDIRRSPLADDYANETSTFIGSRRASASDIIAPALPRQSTAAAGAGAGADTTTTEAAAAAEAGEGYGRGGRQVGLAGVRQQRRQGLPRHAQQQQQQQQEAVGAGVGSVPTGDRARRIVGRDFHSQERGQLSVTAGTILHTVERRGEWYLAEIVDEGVRESRDVYSPSRGQRGERGAVRRTQRQQQRDRERRGWWLSRVFRSNRVSTNIPSANKQQRQEQNHAEHEHGSSSPSSAAAQGRATAAQQVSIARSLIGWIPAWCLMAQFEMAHSHSRSRSSNSSSDSEGPAGTDSAFVSGGDGPLPRKLFVSFAHDASVHQEHVPGSGVAAVGGDGGGGHAITSTPRVRVVDREAPALSRHSTNISSSNSNAGIHHNHHPFPFGSGKGLVAPSNSAVRPFSSPEPKRRANTGRIGSGRSVLSQAPSLLASSMLSSTGVLETIPEDSPKTLPWVTMVYLVVQIVMLVVCLAHEGGIAPLTENPLAGASVKVLRDTGAMWPPGVIDGRLYLLLTSLCVPVGILRLVADAAILVLIGIPVERTHGSRVALAALLVGGVGGNLFACCVLTRHYMTGGGAAAMALVGSVVAGMLIFQHPRRAVVYDLCLAAALTLVASLLGPLPLHNNWQQAGGFIFGLVVSLFTISFASPARPPRGVERTMLTARKLPEGPYLLWRLTRDKRYDLAYAGLFTTALLMLDASSCEWCTRASCFPFYNWCLRDQLASQNTTSGA